MARPARTELAVFQTSLGWIAVAGSDGIVQQVTCGYPSKRAALAAIDCKLEPGARHADWYPDLTRRLQEYADGIPTDFGDIELDLAHLTTFQQRIVKHCRAIPYGESRSYKEVAAAAGSSGAARAVGTTMALNRFSILVPCHRVVHASGTAKNGSAHGLRVRRRLMELERRTLAEGQEPAAPGPMRRARAVTRSK